VGDELGHLPLVEFVLQRLWDDLARYGGAMCHHAYDAMGGLEGALTNTAEAVYDKLSDWEKHAARRIFLQLVRPGEGSEDTRRRATFAELGEEARDIVKQLADARLLVTDHDSGSTDETVELAHEALIQYWGLYKTWLNEDREFLLWRKRLRDAREEWLRTGRDSGALLSGVRLIEADRWCKQHGELTDEEREYIGRSVSLKRRRHGLAGAVVAVVLAAFAAILWLYVSGLTMKHGTAMVLSRVGLYQVREPMMVKVPAGEFLMGSGDDDSEADPAKSPDTES
jgi:hypothetical protein